MNINFDDLADDIREAVLELLSATPNIGDYLESLHYETYDIFEDEVDNTIKKTITRFLKDETAQ